MKELVHVEKENVVVQGLYFFKTGRLILMCFCLCSTNTSTMEPRRVRNMSDTCRTHMSCIFLRICHVSTCRVHFNIAVSIVLNISRHSGISVEISVFYQKRYDKCKNLPDIILDRYELIYCHLADISADIRDEISDISTDKVTYLDNFFFCLRDLLFYSMFILVFQCCFYMIFG